MDSIHVAEFGGGQLLPLGVNFCGVNHLVTLLQSCVRRAGFKARTDTDPETAARAIAHAA